MPIDFKKPQFFKEFRFSPALIWSVINDILTTVTGVSPLTLVNALERRIKRLTQYGKCTQASTPTPSTPVDIKCNNGVVKVGREIYTTPLGRTVYGGTLDVTTGELVVDRAMVDLGTLNWGIDGTRFKASVDGMPNKAGRTIKMLCDCYKSLVNGEAYDQNANNVCYGAYSRVYVHDFAYTDASIFKTAVTGHQLCYELDTPQTYQLTPQTVEMIAERSMFKSNAGNIDITYYANGILKTVNGNPVVIADADGQNAEDVTVHIEPIQSGSGTPSPANIRPISGMTDINITRLGGVVVDGTPEVLTVTGKNLFDISAYDDERVWAGTGYKYIAIPLPNGRYTISWDKSKGGGFYWLAQVDGTKKGTSSAAPGGSWLWHDTNTSLQRETFTFTVTEGYVYFSCSFGGYFVQKFLPALQTVQIEKGETATAYEPYSAQTVSDIPMLLGVEGFADEQDIISGTVTRKCGVLVIDGTEGWALTQTANVYIANNLAANAFKSDTTPACLCTHYKGVAPSIGAPGMGALSIKMGYGHEGGSEMARNRVYLNDTTVGSADGLINFLKAQYANGTPVIIVYPLATETTEQGTPHALTLAEGTNTVEVTAEVNDILIEVSYYQSV